MKKKIINNLGRETELLESLAWDEESLDQLYDYLDVHMTGDSIISPKILLEEIKKNFGEECASVLRNMFLEISLTHGLLTNDPDVIN